MTTESIVRGRREHVTRVRVGRRQDVAMEVHAALRHAGRARRVGDHRDLVPGGGLGGEASGPAALERCERRVAGAGVAGDDQLLQIRSLLLGALQLFAQSAPHDRGASARVRGDVGELASSQEQHRADRDDAELLAREPRDDELRNVGQPQEHTVAAVEADRAEAVTEAVHVRGKLGVGDDALFRVNRRPAAAIPVGVPVEQLDAGVERHGIAQLGQRVHALGHEPGRRQRLPGVRDHASGRTAKPSTSIMQPSEASYRSRTPTSVMAGKCLPKYSR